MQTLQLSVRTEEAASDTFLKTKIAQELNLKHDFVYKIAKRSIDARRKPIKINLKIEVYQNEEEIPTLRTKEYQDISNSNPVIIIGFGPAGMFSALKLIEKGLKPIILERGKDVRNRRRDLAKITKEGVINPESNYCFGEGGAGTFSDGKLYTRSKKRGDVNEILELLVQHGAPKNILVEAHPHIGTNKLPQVVTAIRETILNAGGEIHFNTKVVDFLIESNKVQGV